MSKESFLERDVLGTHKAWASGDISTKDKDTSVALAIARFLAREEDNPI